MLSPDIENAMNTQIAAELYSSHLYLAMSAYCEEQALPGSPAGSRSSPTRSASTP